MSQKWAGDFWEQDLAKQADGRLAPTGTATDIKIETFFQNIFSDHYAFGMYPPRDRLRNEFPPPKVKLSWMFHSDEEEYYIRPKIVRGTSADDREILYDDFLFTTFDSEEFGKSPHDPSLQLNKLNAIIGRVGVGKTTFFSHLLVTGGAERDRNKYFFAHVDFESFFSDVGFNDAIQLDKDSFLELFLDHFIDSLRREFPYCIDEEDRPNIEAVFKNGEVNAEAVSKLEKKITTIVNIFTRLRNSTAYESKTPVLFFDNSDVLYYSFDRVSFFEDGFKLRAKMCEKLASVFRLFLQGGGLCQLSSIIFFGMRKNVYKYLSNEHRFQNLNVEGSPFGNNRNNVYRVEAASPKDVLLGRRRLATKAIEIAEAHSGKDELKRGTVYRAQEDTSAIFDMLVKVGESLDREGGRTSQLVNDLYHLVQKGHRDLIRHLSHFYFGHDYLGVTDRWFRDYAPGIISYLTNMKSIYSHIQSHVPNIMLVRNDVGLEKELAEKYVPDSSDPHQHTYWLKFIIGWFIASKNNRTRIDVLKVFAGTNSDKEKNKREGFYEPHIVRLCLGSLAELRRSGLIEPDWDHAPGSDNPALRPTRRGRVFFSDFTDLKGSEVTVRKDGISVWSFPYLQVIVDDFHFPIPKIKGLENPEWIREKRNYKYLALKKDRDYSQESKAMIRYKRTKVDHFILIIEVALAFEIEKNYRVFHTLDVRDNKRPASNKLELYKNVKTNLQKIRRGEVPFFQSNRIRKDLSRELDRILSPHKRDVQTGEVEENLEDLQLNNSPEDKKYFKELFLFFTRVYYTHKR